MCSQVGGGGSVEGRERGVEPAQVLLPEAAGAALHRRALPGLHRGLQDRRPQHAAPRAQEALQVGGKIMAGIKCDQVRPMFGGT